MESVRQWVRQADIDDGYTPGVPAYPSEWAATWRSSWTCSAAGSWAERWPPTRAPNSPWQGCKWRSGLEASTGWISWCTAATAEANILLFVTPKHRAAGALESVGSRGDSYDNALCESTIGQIKAELIHRRGHWRTVDQLEFALFEYFDWWNHRRLRGELAMSTPIEHEPAYYAQQPALTEVGSQ